ncbi:MAG: DsbA family protein, partial [Cyclobacteriaceae bacterium]
MHKIIYCYDALCGWCYGFSPVMEKIHQQYQQDFQFEVISGGMITGERIGPVGEVAPYIKQAYKLVENTTGVKFGDDFLRVLNEGKAIFTSIPPA